MEKQKRSRFGWQVLVSVALVLLWAVPAMADDPPTPGDTQAQIQTALTEAETAAAEAQAALGQAIADGADQATIDALAEKLGQAQARASQAAQQATDFAAANPDLPGVADWAAAITARSDTLQASAQSTWDALADAGYAVNYAFEEEAAEGQDRSPFDQDAASPV